MRDVDYDFETKLPSLSPARQEFFIQAFRAMWANIESAVDLSPMPSGTWRIEYITEKGIQVSGHTDFYARGCHVDTQSGEFLIPWSIIFGGQGAIRDYCAEASQKVKDAAEQARRTVELERTRAAEARDRAEFARLQAKFTS